MPDQSDTSDRRRRVADRALTAAAVLGALCIVFAVCASVFSLTPLVFRSGSMEPSIPTGSLALARGTSAVEVQVGDVVSVVRSDGSRITHRVDRVDFAEGETAVLILKGDANSTPDADPYILSSADRVVAHVPYAGYAASWLSTPFAWVVGGLAAAALLYVVVRPTSLRRESSVPPGRHRVHSGVAAALVAVVVVPGFAATQGTEAALNDTAQARAVPTAATMVRPASFTCTDSLQGSNRAALLSWPSVDPLYGYRLVFQSEALLGQSRTVNLPAGTLSSYPPAEILSLLQNFTVSLYSRVGEFVSTPALTRRISVTSLGSNGISTCVTPGTVTPTTTTAPLAAARVAPTTTATSPSTTVAPGTTAPAPASTTTAPPVTSTTTTTVAPAPTTTPPVTTTTAAPPPPPPTSTTPPPPPASAFVADGGSATSGTTTASVSGSTLTLSGPDGTPFYSRAVSSSARYGTGVVFSNTGDLYVLSDAGVSRIVVANGVATESAVSTAELPSDISALL
ncbi:signal peptidase I [Rhodococcus sp. MEB064]|uniref:signal peptidase I n=1 Tax=Rhodococcus sp. MEB064 TaxID=1587522 RepID=UPI000696C9E3|nr:signal peptidase I [Rhodococcus sp. MEB064]